MNAMLDRVPGVATGKTGSRERRDKSPDQQRPSGLENRATIKLSKYFNFGQSEYRDDIRPTVKINNYNYFFVLMDIIIRFKTLVVMSTLLCNYCKIAYILPWGSIK